MINLTPVASTKVKEIMTMQNPSPVALRVAVVGLGFGRTFARILNDHPECELVCVADLNEEMAAETAQELRSRGVETDEVRKGRSGCLQFFVADPDSHRIELMQILPDSLQGQHGAPIAQRRTV